MTYIMNITENESKTKRVSLEFEGSYKVRTYERIGGFYSKVKENIYGEQKKAEARFKKLSKEIA